jgi:cell division control protein 24
MYQQTMTLIERMYSHPAMESYLFPMGLEQLMANAENRGQPPIPDPVSLLWHVFRLGAPFCIIYNEISGTPLLVEDVSQVTSYNNVCKKMIYNFIVGVKTLELFEDDFRIFSITDVYKGDISGFTKVFIFLN